MIYDLLKGLRDMKKVTEKDYVDFIRAISEKGIVVPDPPTRVRREGAVQVVEYERDGKVVAQHCSELRKRDRYYISRKAGA